MERWSHHWLELKRRAGFENVPDNWWEESLWNVDIRCFKTIQLIKYRSRDDIKASQRVPRECPTARKSLPDEKKSNDPALTFPYLVCGARQETECQSWSSSNIADSVQTLYTNKWILKCITLLKKICLDPVSNSVAALHFPAPDRSKAGSALHKVYNVYRIWRQMSLKPRVRIIFFFGNPMQ